jgi:hypothetical protein
MVWSTSSSVREPTRNKGLSAEAAQARIRASLVAARLGDVGAADNVGNGPRRRDGWIVTVERSRS